MEALAEGGGYRVTVYRRMRNGQGNKEMKEYGGAGPKRAGVLWMKEGLYAVMWGRGGEEGRGKPEAGGGIGEEANRVRYGRGVPSRATSPG